MATQAARAQRNGRVRAELEDLLERVSKRLGIEVPPPAPTMKDSALQPVVEIERFRDMMVSIEAALDNLSQSEEAPEGKASWTQPMLRSYAKEHDIHIPGDVRRNVDIAAYIDKVEAERKAEAESGDDDDEQPASETDEGSGEADSGESAESESAGSVEADMDSPAGADKPIEPGTGTVTIDSDGIQHVIQPVEGSDQQPGDTIPTEAGKAQTPADSEPVAEMQSKTAEAKSAGEALANAAEEGLNP